VIFVKKVHIIMEHTNMKKQNTYRRHRCGFCNGDTKILERPIWNNTYHEWLCDIECKNLYERDLIFKQNKDK
jgi:hypothetical protein